MFVEVFRYRHYISSYNNIKRHFSLYMGVYIYIYGYIYIYVPINIFIDIFFRCAQFPFSDFMCASVSKCKYIDSFESQSKLKSTR